MVRPVDHSDHDRLAEHWRGALVPERTTRRAARLVEYGLLVALIAIVCIVAVSLLGTNASKKRFCEPVSVQNGCGNGVPGCFGCP